MCRVFARRDGKSSLEDLHIPREKPARELASIYGRWVANRHRKDVPANVALIYDDGLAGKSEFLRNEGRNALIGVSRKTPGTSYYAFCDLDIGRRRNLRPINVFLLLRQALAAASVKTPRLDHGLARYNEITGGGLARANPRMDWVDLMRRRAEATSAAIDVGGAMLAAAVGAAGMGMEVEVAVAGAVEIGVAVGKKALEGELDLRKSDARRREDIDRELSSPDLREISANLYKYLMYDIEALDGPLCLVLDSLEAFFDY